MVPGATVVLCALNLLLGIGIPVALVVWLHKKYGLGVIPAVIGAGVMVVFALILEQQVHGIVLGSAWGAASIRGNLFAYACYGGLMAGLFEETGRFLAMRFALKKHHGEPRTALMYGAGHGGIEMAILLCSTMLNNLIYSVMINLGQTETVLSALEEPVKSTLQATFSSLIQAPSWQFLVSPVERLAALTAQLGLSVLVWFAATGERKDRRLFPLAILLHAVLDAVSAVAAGAGLNLLLVEALVWVMAIGIALLGRKVYRDRTAIG